MLKFVCGRMKSGKTSYLIEEIRKNSSREILFIVPEQYSHSMERLMCEYCGNSVSAYAEVTNFRRLATKVRCAVGGVATETVGGGRRILLLHSAIGEVAPLLKSLAKTAGRPERLEELLSAIDEFKAYGISPEALAAATKNLSPRCAGKLSDLSLIYAAYENKLGEDEFDAYDELASVAEDIKRYGYFKGKTVIMDGFSGFTAAEFDIISAAIAQADDVYIALEIPENEDSGAESGIFDKAFDTKKRIIELVKRNGEEYEEEHLMCEKEGALYHIDKMLFSDVAEKYEGAADEITIARADSPFEECELAAAYIIDNIRNKGMRYRDFSVAVSSAEEYLRTCETVFTRYGIPVYIASARELISKPAIAVIIAALECIIRGYKPDAVMEYLKTGFSGVSSRSLDIFENYMYTWMPKASMWYGGKDFTKNPLGIAAEETEESREILRIVNCVRRKIYEPIERLASGIKKGKTGEKCAEALYNFINEINLPRRCAAYSYLSERSERYTDAREYERIMSILCDAIDNIGQAVGDREIDVSDLYLLFKIVVSQYELDTIPASLDCVSIGDVSRADGERCRARIILGANDSLFPKPADNGGFLSNSDRTELSDYGIELSPGMSERIFEQYRTVHNVVCSAEEMLYISSVAIIGGEEGCEAQCVSRLREMFSCKTSPMSIHEARLRAKVPCFDECIATENAEEIWEKDEEYRLKLCRAKENAKSRRGPVAERDNIEAIFGSKIRLSASRADLFSSCRYAYFLKYGLNAKKRERAEITAIEAGTLMHYVLEKVFSELSESGVFDEAKALEIAEVACREYIEETLRGEESFSGRNEFLLRRLEKSVKYAVCDICRELSKSEFCPREFELSFTGGEDSLPPIEIEGKNSRIVLRGAVDRVDMYEKEGKLYFRVVDYKSGKKKFSLEETVNGVGMQMLLYMFAIEEMGISRYGKEPIPAGVMYVPISRELNAGRGGSAKPVKREGVVLRDMSIINAMERGDEKEYIPVSLDTRGGLKSNSVVLSGVEFDKVKKHMKSILAKIGDELCRGIIEPNPYCHGSHTSCDWCEYRSVCAFDEERTEDRMRELVETEIKDILGESGGEAVE